MKSIPGYPDPLPVKLGDQLAELWLDLETLFQVYLVRYAATAPTRQVEAYLAKAGVSALVLFTRDGQSFHLSYVADGRATSTRADRAWVESLLTGLHERYKQTSDVLELGEWVQSAIQAQAEQETLRQKRSYRNQGLFSEHYLGTRLRESPEWQEDPEPLRKKLLELYQAKESLLKGANEAQTEDEFIRPVLEALGFAYWVQDTTKATGGPQRPDYVLYPDEGTKSRAVVHKADEAKRYAPALAIAEAKYWGRDLDVKRKDGRDRVQSPVSPSFQLSEYLSATSLEWGILTNGQEWRLYWGKAADKQKRYFAVDLVQALQDPEAFRFFWLFFRREAFIKGAQGSFLGRILEGSEQYGLRVGKRLKDVVFEQVFPLLAEGFLHHHKEVMGQPADEATLRETYRATLSLLYRLLFLLYAEDRDLLPVSDTLGYQQYSLARLRREIADGLDKGQVHSEHSYRLWEHLATLFNLIDRGDRALRVPPYNGGLFKPGVYPFLDTHKVADAFLAPALDKLARQEDEDGKLRFVDYKYLTVRELGAVYEGLLEFSLKVAEEDLVAVKDKDREVYKPKAKLASKEKPVAEVPKGKPYLVNDKKERHASGSYYTPDYVVEYIVRRALEPVVAKRKEALEKVLKEYAHWSKEQDKRPTRENVERLAELRHKALETLLDVKVVDPAMGSGHFLVGAVDFLSECFANLITEFRAEPITDALAGLRDEIKVQMKQYGLELKDEQLSDINLLKRMVMKRCVFGVDLNPMAVELAKLSLWLDAFTVGAPLSFLDHHLRHGNSVLGVSRSEFVSWVERENPVWLSELEREVEEATRKAQELLEVGDLTPAEVVLSQRLYAQAEEALLPLRRALDVYAAGFFASKPKKGQPTPPLFEARTHLPTLSLPTLADPPAKYHLREAIAFARERHFFHWEFEFPEVFFGPERKYNPGFDAVIGNPPYVRQEQLGPNKPFFEKAYETIYAGAADLYTYFFARGLGVLRDGGRLGFISSRQFTRAAYGEGLRKLLTAHALQEITDFGENPVFEGVGTFPAIFILEKGQPAYSIRYKAVSKAEFSALIGKPSEARAEELAQMAESGQSLGPEAFRPEGWTLGSADENAILRKMEANGVPLGEYVEGIYYGIKTGLNEAFFIDEPTRNRLIKEDPKSAKLIKPLLVGDDVRHYYARWPKSYLILIPSGSDFDEGSEEHEILVGIPRHPWADSQIQEEAEQIFKETYPAIYKHLVSWRDKLKARSDQGRWWWELRPCAYYQLLEAPKIVYPVIAKEPRFYLDTKGFYLNDKLFFIPQADWYLLAVLNSRVAFGILKLKLSAFGDADEGGRLELRAVHLQHLPIPKLPHTTQASELEIALEEARKHYAQGEVSAALTWAEKELVAGRRDTVAAFLGFLAQEMQRMQAERLSLEGGWRGWVEHAFQGTGKLGKEWLAEDWAREGLGVGVEAITERFKVKRVKTTPQTLAQLKKHTQETLDQLRPLYQRLEATDRLIDRLVARLYGLTDEEAERLWATPSS